MELLNYFNIALWQPVPNSWKIVISCLEIWMVITDGDMIRLDEFVHMHRLKESKEYGYYEMVPWVRQVRIITDLPSSFWYWNSRYFFMSGDGWETLSNDFWGEVPRLLRRWRSPNLGASSATCFLIVFLLKPDSSLTFVCRVRSQLRSTLSLRADIRSVSRWPLST